VLQSDPNVCHPALILRGKAMARHADKLLSLFVDVLQSTEVNDPSRLQELLAQHATMLQNRKVKNALNYAVQTALSPFSSTSFVYDQWNGIPYYQMILAFMKNPTSLVERFLKMQQQVLQKGQPHLVMSCE